MPSINPMISIAPGDLDPRAADRLLSSVVAPCPIGWTSTIGVNGALNLAPFSFFNEMDEFDRAGVTPASSIDVKPPRVAEVPIALECKVTQIVPVIDTTYTLILGRVLRFHIRSDVLRPNGLVDALLLKSVARLSGDEYATLERVFDNETII